MLGSESEEAVRCLCLLIDQLRCATHPCTCLLSVMGLSEEVCLGTPEKLN